MPTVIRGVIRHFPEEGDWDASAGELHGEILLMRSAMRRTECCGEPLELVAAVEEHSFTWGLWRCRVCGSEYSIGPKLPSNTWVSKLGEICAKLYAGLEAEVERKRDAGEL
jgi:hypothetical protein